MTQSEQYAIDDLMHRRDTMRAMARLAGRSSKLAGIKADSIWHDMYDYDLMDSAELWDYLRRKPQTPDTYNDAAELCTRQINRIVLDSA